MSNKSADILNGIYDRFIKSDEHPDVDEIIKSTPGLKIQKNKKHVYAIYIYFITIDISTFVYKIYDFDSDDTYLPKDNELVKKESESNLINCIDPDLTDSLDGIEQYMIVTAIFDKPKDKIQFEQDMVSKWEKTFSMTNNKIMLPNYNPDARSLIQAVYNYILRKGK